MRVLDIQPLSSYEIRWPVFWTSKRSGSSPQIPHNLLFIDNYPAPSLVGICICSDFEVCGHVKMNTIGGRATKFRATVAIFSCFEWLGLLCCSRLGGSPTDNGRDLFKALPADVVVDILCRLSTDQIILDVYSICNPVTHEHKTLKVTSVLLCGLFYNSLTRKYGILCIDKVAGCGFVYFICNHCGASSRSIGYPWHIPRDHLPALNMGDFLYWVARWEAPCASCIIEFNLVTEKLVLMAHPRGSFRDRMDHQNMFVLEMEGQLCFTHVSEISRTIRISVLRDQVRTKRFNVSLEWIAWWLRYDLFPSYYWIKPLGIQGGELILAWHTTGIIKYHLLHRSH
ncbi:hypothetical protein CRG98_041516 [Punica granatum]|uniref:F-box associated beta-propeller type 3 domain-containing protein n=1 Tax=Punica granatum TaxID=22663 RepID=A0A2I0I2B8_PUNGR|nr:hypothetical protein CRG98_041516 [Punica granatum]